MTRIENSFPAISPNDLKELDDRIGLSLPPMYRQFLLKSNGGRPVPNEFSIRDCDASAIVGVFYGIRKLGDPLDLATEYAEWADRIPSGFMPIGEDPGGNRILLGTLGKRSGNVYYWDSSNYFSSTTENWNTYWLADSISDFLAALK